MQVHQGSSIFHHPLTGVDESFGKFYAIVDVVAASAPVKIAFVVTVSPSFLTVTGADLHFPLTAGPGNGVDHSC